MKVTATTLPRKSASETRVPSCEVNANAGAGAILGSRCCLAGWWGASCAAVGVTDVSMHRGRRATCRQRRCHHPPQEGAPSRLQRALDDGHQEEEALREVPRALERRDPQAAARRGGRRRHLDAYNRAKRQVDNGRRLEHHARKRGRGCAWRPRRIRPRQCRRGLIEG
jgi:hypothetical protein